MAIERLHCARIHHKRASQSHERDKRHLDHGRVHSCASCHYCRRWRCGFSVRCSTRHWSDRYWPRSSVKCVREEPTGKGSPGIHHRALRGDVITISSLRSPTCLGMSLCGRHTATLPKGQSIRRRLFYEAHTPDPCYSPILL